MKHKIISRYAKNHIWLSQLNSMQYEVLEKMMNEYAECKTNKNIDNELYEKYYKDNFKVKP